MVFRGCPPPTRSELLPALLQDSLAEEDKIILETARFLKDDFLQQNSFTKFDKGLKQRSVNLQLAAVASCCPWYYQRRFDVPSAAVDEVAAWCHHLHHLCT